MATSGVQPRVRATEIPEAQSPGKHIIVYICPTPGCPNFYAAPEFVEHLDPTITRMQVARSQNDGHQYETHPRTECPDCRARSNGKLHVQRVPYIVTEVVELRGALAAMEKARARAEAAERDEVRASGG